MRLPTPDDPADALVWENYVVAQTAQASLGIIPLHALAVGVTVSGTSVVLRFQLSAVTPADEEDMSDIASELQDLVGDHVRVDTVRELREERLISPDDAVRYVFLARQAD
jgi:hypothetical protein